MSHSKLDKLPADKRSPELARFVVRCAACGRTGLDASIDWESDSLLAERYHPVMKQLLLRHYEALPLDEREMCDVCAAAFDRFADLS